MKVLIVNSLDIRGGAARAAYRLHQSLLSLNIDSQMLVQSKSSDDWTVIGPTSNIQKGLNSLRPILDSIPVKFLKNKTKTLFSVSWLGFSGVVNKINKINPDIVHLHWICGGMIRIEDIARIKAPIVWSLHDMWAFTDGYHYDEAYDINKNGCQHESKNFLNDIIFKRKRKAYSNVSNITIIGLSKWLNECSKNSVLLRDKRHITLPNPIDTDVFKPFDKVEARKLWNFPQDKKIILFGAVGATSDPRKGFKELSKALHGLGENSNIEFAVFGGGRPEQEINFNLRTHYLGCLSDDVSLVSLYSAVDVMVVPSLQENLSNAIMESLACGTPVVAFDIGGNSDMIIHKENGYLADPFDTVDLKNGIEWILNSSNTEEIRNNSRKKVLDDFDSIFVVKKYIKLYQNIIEPRE